MFNNYEQYNKYLNSIYNLQKLSKNTIKEKKNCIIKTKNICIIKDNIYKNYKLIFIIIKYIVNTFSTINNLPYKKLEKLRIEDKIYYNTIQLKYIYIWKINIKYYYKCIYKFRTLILKYNIYIKQNKKTDKFRPSRRISFTEKMNIYNNPFSHLIYNKHIK